MGPPLWSLVRAGPISGPTFGVHFWAQPVPENGLQVALFLIWAQHLHNTGHDPDNAIWLSTDETALPLVFAGRHGNVHQFRHAANIRVATPASLAQRRAHCTLVATVSSDPALQGSLPQVLLPNTKGKKRIWTAAQDSLDPASTIRIIPDAQGWVNNKKLVQILNQLHDACQAYNPAKKYVLVWDCHPTHISPAILRHARKKKFSVLLVPSKLTHLLQVLDFAVFASLKQELHRAHLQSFVGAATAAQPLDKWITVTTTCINHAMRNVDARAAFASAGQARNTQPYRSMVQRWLPKDWGSTGRPLTQDELWFLIGRRQRHVHKLLFPGA